MKFLFKDLEYNLPTSLNEITLQQRIDFDNRYGKEIETKRSNLFKKDNADNDIPVDEMELLFFNIDVANKNFSFFSGIPIDEIESSIAIEDVLNIYYSCFQQIDNQQKEIELKTSYYWDNELWIIEQPELSYQSKTTFNELIIAKQIVKQMHDLGAGQWESLPFLACVFLRKENETFDELWMVEGSERMQKMKILPMDIALAVCFFLQNSMITYQLALAFSQEESQQKGLI